MVSGHAHGVSWVVGVQECPTTAIDSPSWRNKPPRPIVSGAFATSA